MFKTEQIFYAPEDGSNSGTSIAEDVASMLDDGLKEVKDDKVKEPEPKDKEAIKEEKPKEEKPKEVEGKTEEPKDKEEPDIFKELNNLFGGAPVEPVKEEIEKEESKKEEPKKEEPKDKVTEFNFSITEEDFVEANQSREAFVNVLKGVAKEVYDRARADIQADVKSQMDGLLQGVSKNVNRTVSTYTAARDFWKDNKDLIPISNVVKIQATKVQGVHPDWTPDQVLAETGKEVRRAVEALTGKKIEKNSNFAPSPRGRAGETKTVNKNDLSNTQKEILDLME